MSKPLRDSSRFVPFALSLGAGLVPHLAVAMSPAGQLAADGFEDCGSTPVRVQIPRAGTALEGWLYASGCATRQAPAVVLLHGCSGVYGNQGYGDAARVSSHFQDWGRQLNREGKHVLLVDSFSTRSALPPSQSRQDYCGDRSAIEAIHATEESDRPFDALAGALYLRAWQGDGGARVDAARISLMGWSHGGSAAMAAAAAGVLPEPGHFDRAIVFYPGCGMYGRFGSGATSSYEARIPLDIFIGTADPISSIQVCGSHAAHSNLDHPGSVQIHTFENARHNFDSASCVQDASGQFHSPWSGLAYHCTALYQGEPLDLFSWRARVLTTSYVRCRLDAGACAFEAFIP